MVVEEVLLYQDAHAMFSLAQIEACGAAQLSQCRAASFKEDGDDALCELNVTKTAPEGNIRKAARELVRTNRRQLAIKIVNDERKELCFMLGLRRVKIDGSAVVWDRIQTHDHVVNTLGSRLEAPMPLEILSLSLECRQRYRRLIEVFWCEIQCNQSITLRQDSSCFVVTNSAAGITIRRLEQEYC